MVDLSSDPIEQFKIMVNELRNAHIEVVEQGKRVKLLGKENGGIQIFPYFGFS
jgi:ribosome-interacting GTPase 1